MRAQPPGFTLCSVAATSADVRHRTLRAIQETSQHRQISTKVAAGEGGEQMPPRERWSDIPTLFNGAARRNFSSQASPRFRCSSRTCERATGGVTKPAEEVYQPLKSLDGVPAFRSVRGRLAPLLDRARRGLD